ncbi:MAG: hypothetical protein JWQ00_1031 [Noviherbaspirillum sp.]|nr:hypothetical protein [Noviherbaspirillum sp.]
MKTWPDAIRDGIASGSVASIASTAVLSACGKKENGTPYAPTNAISHWFWGERATRRDGLSARYTLLGYAIHHASSLLWATVYERFVGHKAKRKEALPAIAGGLAVAGLACFVDYKLTPYRLQPGFEKRLSTPSMALVYGSFGLALALHGLTAASRRQAEK